MVILCLLCCAAISNSQETTIKSLIKTNVLSYGAKGDNFHDDTLAFQTALKQNTAVMVPAGRYILTASLKLTDHQTLTLSDDTSLIFKCHKKGCFLLDVDSKVGVTIEGGTLDGDRANNPYGALMGVVIRGNSRHITVNHVVAMNFPSDQDIPINDGDGFYVGARTSSGEAPYDIKISGVTSICNGRNGLSVTAGRQVAIERNTFGNCGLAGVDLEPNGSNTCENIVVADNTVFGCRLGLSVSKGARWIVAKGNSIIVPRLTKSYKGIELHKPAMNMTISGNTVTGGNTGIEATGFGSIIEGNNIRGSRNGVYIGADGAIIEGNCMLDCWENGLFIEGSDCVTADNSLVITGDQQTSPANRVGEALIGLIHSGSSNATVRRAATVGNRPIVRKVAAGAFGRSWTLFDKKLSANEGLNPIYGRAYGPQSAKNIRNSNH